MLVKPLPPLSRRKERKNIKKHVGGVGIGIWERNCEQLSRQN
jgi:hypothetical protein